LGVNAARIHVDHGLTGTNRERPGLREALAACREGDTLVVTKLDRLARSLPDARAIADELTARQVRLNLGGSVYDPNDAVGRLLFNVLAMVAEFESDLIRLRTREGMKVAKAKGRLRGKQPKLNPRQEAHLVELFETGEHSTAELADLFGVGRSTVYRALQEASQRQSERRPAALPQTTPRRTAAGLTRGDAATPQAVRLATHGSEAAVFGGGWTHITKGAHRRDIWAQPRSGALMGQPSVASGRDEADHQRSMTDPDESGRAQGIERSPGRVRSAVVMARLRARGG